eukprot:gene6603-10766_t
MLKLRFLVGKNLKKNHLSNVKLKYSTNDSPVKIKKKEEKTDLEKLKGLPIYELLTKPYIKSNEILVHSNPRTPYIQFYLVINFVVTCTVLFVTFSLFTNESVMPFPMKVFMSIVTNFLTFSLLYAGYFASKKIPTSVTLLHPNSSPLKQQFKFQFQNSVTRKFEEKIINRKDVLNVDFNSNLISPNYHIWFSVKEENEKKPIRFLF